MSVETEPIDMDALFETGLQADAVAAAEKAMLLPVGNYLTVAPAATTLKKYEATADKPERLVARVYSAIVQKGGEGREGRIGFNFSPDMVKVHKDDGSEDFDRSYKNYVMLHRAFRTAYGQAPATVGQIVEYLKTYPVGLRVIQMGTQEDSTGEPGNMVVAISAVKE